MDASEGNILTVEGLSKFYARERNRVDALREVSICVRPGEFVGIAGPSGCGKSTLLNIVGLCEAPSAGSVVLVRRKVDFGDDRGNLIRRRGELGYIFQYFNLLPSLSASENVALTLIINGVARDSADRRARALLSELGLGRHLDHYPHELSGGQMQRVAVCRALIHGPALILADEPTGNLDSHSGAEVIALLDARRKSGSAVLMASHSEKALQSCDRVYELNDGRISGERLAS